MKELTKLSLLTTVGLCALSMPSHADSVNSLIEDGNFYGEVRYRYENVDQDGFTEDANASTIRTNLGFKTGVYHGLQALIEAQIVQNLGSEDFNSTTNGSSTFPIIADPDVTELNELWLSWSGLPQTTAKIGRQEINIDNQRFVGTVAWRQNDQTFDAAVISNSSIENLNLMYGYVGNVNRIQGGGHALGDLDTQAHVLHASYALSDWLIATAYGYWLDIDEAASLSSKTYGLRATGKAQINEDWTFGYEAEYAMQEDHGDNTANYDENYYHVAPSISGHGLTFKLGYEVLEGDGTNAFQTPLATGHKFNGWADAFLTTPDAGLEDAYVSASYKVSGTDSIFDGTKFTAVYHDFSSVESTVGDFGNEIDLAIGKTFTLPDAGQPFKKVNITLKYASYDGENSAGTDAGRDKIWLQIGTKF